jgi:hypothetical protein
MAAIVSEDWRLAHLTRICKALPEAARRDINQATSSWTPQASEAHEIAPSGLTMSTNQWPD